MQTEDLTDVQRAERKLDNATEGLKRWEYQRDQYMLDLREAEQSVGEKVIGSVPLGDTVTKEATQDAVQKASLRIVELRAEVEATTSAVETAKQKIASAQRQVWMAQADELLKEAGTLRARAVKRQEKTDALLEKLLDWEGVGYVPARPDERSISEAARMGGQQVVITIPKTQALINEAVQLEHQAQHLIYQAESTPEARQEQLVAANDAYAETLRHTNEENMKKYFAGQQASVRAKIDRQNKAAQLEAGGVR
jgi:hypothetical protein